MKPAIAILLPVFSIALLHASGALAGDPAIGDPAARGVDTWPAELDSAQVVQEEWVSFSCPLLVYSTPREVWEVLSTVRSFSMWYPHWRPEKDLMRELAAPGDTITFYLDDMPAGRSVVTWLDPLKELRIVHEATGGAELGRVRMKLEPARRGVGLLYEESLPAAGIDVLGERRQVCKRAFLIKRLAEGEH